jgi:hypothetical protein
MSLKLLQPGVQPLGQFDGLDTEVLTLKGGEVVTFASISSAAGVDKASKDVFDGYVNPSLVQKRVVVTKTLTSGKRPLMLADEGITGYGTLFGTVVGGTVGQVSTGGAVLGPHTATGSGKVTLWEKPGLYAVSLDACDTTSSTGLQPTNTTLDTGAALYATAAGLLTPNSGAAFEAVVVGRFVSFETNGSLVSTPSNLVAALNPPDGALSSTYTKQFTFATFYFNPPAA